jgi:hypothetical protein
METFKVEHFESDHGFRTFPAFRTLSKEEADRIFVMLKKSLRMSADLPSLEVLELIE